MQIPVGFRIVSDTGFERRVAEMVQLVPEGRVASYGRIAEWIGAPGAARAVGGVLARAGGQMPAHRIVNASGRLAPGWEREQAELLRSEGVRVRGGAVASPMPWWAGPASRQ